jgi:hypothetical protein
MPRMTRPQDRMEAGRFVLHRGKNGRAVFRRKTLRSRLHQYRLSYQLVGV